MFTTLAKEAMPVIRYRTRDLSKLMLGSETVMRRMEKITGRSDDMMIICGVNLFPPQIEEQIFKVADLSPHYQLEICREDNLDKLTVNVEVRSNDLNGAARTEAAEALQYQVKTMVGISAQVNVRAEGEVVRSQGKAQRVVDLRK